MPEERSVRRLPPSVDYGWGRDHLRIQLAESGIDDATLDRFDLHATAVIRLHVGGIITDAERSRAAQRLTKAIQTAFRKLVPLSPHQAGDSER